MANLLYNAHKKNIGKREYSFDVNSLNPYVHEWKIKVKILSKFTCLVNSNETLDLVLVDCKGQKIHAVIPKEFAGRFSARLIEGTWICLSSFGLGRVMGTFRPTDHRFMIYWQTSTWFTNIMSLNSDEFYSFVTFEDIKSGSLDPNYCVDLIGRVTNVGNCKEEGPPDHDYSEIFFDLENVVGDRLPCRLPKVYANDFFNGWRHCVDRIVICIMRFAKLEINQGTWRATTAHTCTKVLVDPLSVHVSQMKDVFAEMGTTE